MEAWEFLLAGGGLYNNLDYSFVVGHEDGTFEYPKTQPGGGDRKFRQQMKVLKELPLWLRLRADEAGQLRHQGSTRKGGRRERWSNAEERWQSTCGRTSGESRGPHHVAEIELTNGAWKAESINPASGAVLRRVRVDGGGARALEAPPFETDIALRLTRE